MALCPQCRAEYPGDITHCAVCDLELVESLPASPVEEPVAAEPEEELPEPSGPLVVIHADDHLHDVQLVREMLSEEGIDAVILSYVEGTIASPAARGGLFVAVASAQAELARQLIEEQVRPKLYQRCPECGAEYLPTITHCPVCKVDLIDALPLEQELTPVYAATDVLEAKLVVETLLAEGLEATLLSRQDSAFPTSGVQSGHKVAVPAAEARQARNVLELAIEQGVFGGTGELLR